MTETTETTETDQRRGRRGAQSRRGLRETRESKAIAVLCGSAFPPRPLRQAFAFDVLFLTFLFLTFCFEGLASIPRRLQFSELRKALARKRSSATLSFAQGRIRMTLRFIS